MKSIVSLLIGEQSDKRLMQALASRKQEYYDHSVHYIDRSQGPQPDKDRPRDGIWIDHISDTGDGWNPTYAVAMAAAQRTLTVHGAHGELQLPRADVLVFGGDEVYPAHPVRNINAGWWHRTPRPSAMTSPRSDRTCTPFPATTIGMMDLAPSRACSVPTSVVGGSRVGGHGRNGATSC
jgi:hypothetical protein